MIGKHTHAKVVITEGKMQGIDDDFRENLPSVVITQSSRPYHNGEKIILKSNLITVFPSLVVLVKTCFFKSCK